MKSLTSPRIGYIGLGIMGAPMARNLLAAGYELHVWARREASTVPLRALGAVVHSSPADLARAVDVVFTNVSDTPDVEQVVLGEQGLLEGSHEHLLIIDNSTICPDATRRIAEHVNNAGAAYLDAPVSGGDVGAKAGTLSIMVGGDTKDVARAQPLFDVLGSNTVHVGDAGAGQVCKACNQILVAQTIAAVGEAMLMAQSMNVDANKVRQALLGGFAQSRILDIHGERILQNQFEPGFKAALHHGDMNIALDAAQARGLVLKGAQLANENLKRLVESGRGEEDTCAQYKVIAEASGRDF